MKAILLAAGEGSRLRPLTINKPKPMIRAANKPMAQYPLEALVAQGIKDVTLVVGYQRARLQTYFGDGRKFGARITYAFQEGLLGTAHAVATAPDPREPFLVLGGDNVVDAGLIRNLLDAGVNGPSIVVHKSDTPSKYGVVTMEGDRVRSIVEQPPNPASDWVNTGVYRFPADFHAHLRDGVKRGLLGLTDVLADWLREGNRITATKSQGLWADAVYPWDLLKIHAELTRLHPPSPVQVPGVHVDQRVLLGSDVRLDHSVVLSTGTCVGSNVQIGANSTIENSIIYDDVQIGPGAILQNTVVGEGTRIGPRFTAVSGECDVKRPDGWHHLDDFGAVIGEDARIGGNVTLKPGTMLGNRVRVDHGRVVSGTVDDQGIVA